MDELEARLVRITEAGDPRAADYRDVREAELVRRRGVFIAEGTEVVRTLVTRGRFPVRSILLAEKLVPSMRDVILRAPKDTPVYVAPGEVMSAIAGFDIHRGCLAAGERIEPKSWEVLLEGERAGEGELERPEIVLVAEAIANHDNVGGLFRCAAAFGARVVLLDPRSADPLYRKAIRVSMGATLTVPFARVAPWPEALDQLRARGFELWALALVPGAKDLITRVANGTGAPDRVALVVGTEGTGLTAEALARTTERFVIPMAEGVDSLNVATASAIGLFTLRALGRRA